MICYNVHPCDSMELRLWSESWSHSGDNIQTYTAVQFKQEIKISHIIFVILLNLLFYRTCLSMYSMILSSLLFVFNISMSLTPNRCVSTLSNFRLEFLISSTKILGPSTWSIEGYRASTPMNPITALPILPSSNYLLDSSITLRTSSID